MSKTVVAEDKLEYVRARIADSDKIDFKEVAEKSGVVLRTLYQVRRGDTDPRYSTVSKLYAFLKANEPKALGVRAKVTK